MTLLGDAGTAGAANFHAYRKLAVKPSKTDILCFLNLAVTGLVKLPEIWSEGNMNDSLTGEVIEANRDVIRGVKLRCVEALAQGVGIKAMEAAKKLASDHKIPLMIHIGEPRARTADMTLDDFTKASVSLLEEGDILSHYLTWEPGGLIRRDGVIYPELEQAQKRKVVLDPSHGLNHFSFTVARLAIEAGYLPTVITTDLASVSLPSTQSLAVFMSKFLNLGLSVNQVIEMATINAAKALGEAETRGSLKPGMPANITVLELMKGRFTFCDGTGGERMDGELLLEPRMVCKAGKLYPAFSGYHAPPRFERKSEL